jgi:hypothetical protein
MLLLADLSGCGPAFVVESSASDAGGQALAVEAGVDVPVEASVEGAVVDRSEHLSLPEASDAPLAPETATDSSPVEVDAAPVCAYGNTRCQGYSVQVCNQKGQWAGSTRCQVECCPGSAASINGTTLGSSPYCSAAGCTAPLIAGQACGDMYTTFCPSTSVCTTTGSCP